MATTIQDNVLEKVDFMGFCRLLKIGLDYRNGRGDGIRTHGELPHTRVPGVLLQPLGHPSTCRNKLESISTLRLDNLYI